MDPLHIILFLVGVALCIVAIMIVNGRILAKKRKKTKLGLVKIAGSGIDIGDSESETDTPAAAPDVAAGADAEEADETVSVPFDYVDVDVDEEAVETMAMPLPMVMNGGGAAKSAASDDAQKNDDTKENDCIPQKDNAKKAPEISERRLPETVNIKDRMILLVEDVQVNRELITIFFEDTGLKFDSAENGLVAYEKFENNPKGYCLILMDIQMPGMDGYETARKIRALDVDWAKQIPIIAMTANVFKEDIDACFDAGMDDHVAKPLDMEELRDKVFEFISMSAE